MSITHIVGTDGKRKSKRFSFDPKPSSVDTADIRRQIRLSKDGGHSRLPIHHTTIEKLCEAWETLNGKPEDRRRKYGEHHDDA